VHVDRRLSLWRQLVDHVGGDIAQQQVAAFLDPDDPLGETEAALDELKLRVLRHERVEGRVEPDHDRLVGLGARPCGESSQAPDSGIFLHEPSTHFFAWPLVTGILAAAPSRPRRRLLAAAALLPVSPAFAQSRPLTCGELTAAQTEGPFFKTNTPLRAS